MFTTGNDNVTFVKGVGPYGSIQGLVEDALAGNDRIILNVDPDLAIAMSSPGSDIVGNSIEGSEGKDSFTVLAKKGIRSLVNNNTLTDSSGDTKFKIEASNEYYSHIDGNEFRGDASGGHKFDLKSVAKSESASVEHNELYGGLGKDSVKILAQSTTNDMADRVTIRSNEIILGNGKNSVALTASEKGKAAQDTLVNLNTLVGGDDADTIKIKATGTDVTMVGNSIDAGDGKNSVSIAAKGSSGSSSIRELTVMGGTGDDKVSITSQLGVTQSEFRLGDGKNQFSASSNAFDNNSLSMGDGDDRVTLKSTLVTIRDFDLGAGKNTVAISQTDKTRSIFLNNLDGGAGAGADSFKISQSGDSIAQISNVDLDLGSGNVNFSISQKANGQVLTDNLNITSVGDTKNKFSAKLNSKNDMSTFKDSDLNFDYGNDNIKIDVTASTSFAAAADAYLTTFDASIVDSVIDSGIGSDKISLKAVAPRGGAAINGINILGNSSVGGKDSIALQVSGELEASFEDNIIANDSADSKLKVQISAKSGDIRATDNDLMLGDGADISVAMSAATNIYASGNSVTAGDDSKITFKLDASDDIFADNTSIIGGYGKLTAELRSDLDAVVARNSDFVMEGNGDSTVDVSLLAESSNVTMNNLHLGIGDGDDDLSLDVKSGGNINANGLSLTDTGGSDKVDLSIYASSGNVSVNSVDFVLEGGDEELDITAHAADGTSQIDSGTFDLNGNSSLNSIHIDVEGTAALFRSNKIYNEADGTNFYADLQATSSATYFDSNILDFSDTGDNRIMASARTVDGNAFMRFNSISTGDASNDGGDQLYLVAESTNGALQFSFNTLVTGDGDDLINIVADSNGTPSITTNSIYSGDGNDVVRLEKSAVSLTFSTINAGDGIDRLILDNPGAFQAIGSSVNNFEQIELSGGDFYLSIYNKVEMITDADNELFVFGSKTDTVGIGAGYNYVGALNQYGTNFLSYSDGNATVHLQSGIIVA